MANLEGMEGIELLKGASWERERVVSMAAMAVWAGGTGGCVPSTCCRVAAGGW